MSGKFEILNYNSDEGVVYFKFLGDTEINAVVFIQWNNLTIHYNNMNFGANPNAIYYIGFNKKNISQIDEIEIKFSFNDCNEIYKIKINENLKIPHKEKTFFSDEKDCSFYSFNEIFIKKIYDDKLVRIYEGDIVVDIGANYGFFSLYSEGFNPSKTICIEPSKRISSFLNNNVSHSEVLEFAVGGSSSFQRFKEIPHSSASSLISDDGDYQVEVVGINDLLSRMNLKQIDFLKIDCEGSEKQIFENITYDTINKINKIVVEFHSDETKEFILSKFENFGFRVEKVTSELIFAYKKNYFKNKKKIALVSTYCDNQEKKDVFLNLVKKVKSCGVDVIAISPLPLDKEHIEACDFIYFTKENPILTWPVRLFTFWKELQLPDGRISTMQRGVGDYSWAALYHVKKLTQIAMDYDYDIFYHMIYDLDIDDVVEKALKDFEGNIVYPRRDPHHPETLWETTLHFMSFDKDLMKKIEKEISLEEYLSTNGVAEGEVLKWRNKFNIDSSEHPVKDLIFYWKGHDFFDYSPVKDFKMFLSKNDEMTIWLGESPIYSSILPKKFRITFYDFSGDLNLTVIINELEFDINPKPFEFEEFEIESQKIQELKIKYNNQLYDISKSFKDISMNQIYYNHRP